MELDLAPQGAYCPSPRLGAKELEAIRMGCMWDANVETLETAENKWLAAKADGGLDITFPVKKKTKGKQKAEDDNDADEDEDEVELDEAGKTIPPPIELPGFWLDVSNTKDIIAKIDMVQWRMALEKSCTALTVAAKERIADRRKPLPTKTMGWQALLTAVFWAQTKGHDPAKNVHCLINTMVWEEAVVSMYRRDFIEKGAGGTVRKMFEEILDGYCVPTLEEFYPSGTVDTSKFIWWDTFRAPANPTTCQKSFNELISETRRIAQWKVVMGDLNRINKIVENIPCIRLPGDETSMSSLVHQSMTSIYKASFKVQ